MADKSRRVSEVRSLTSAAQEMVDHARELMAQSDAETADPAKRDELRGEAEKWLGKAREIAQTANRLAKK